MSKELQALQDLSKLVFIYGGVEQYKIIEQALKALEIIKKFADYQIVSVQGQWYIMQGVSFDKSLKLPITEEQAILLQEVLL